MGVIDTKLLLPCPFCGHTFEHDDPRDTVYPAGRSVTFYQLVCQESAGGCGATVYGVDANDAVVRWNMRAS